MVLCMAEAQKQGYTPIIIDTEGGVTDEFCKRWGLDTENCLYNYTPWVEEILPILAQCKDMDDEKFIIGLDSVGGMELMKLYDDALKGDPKADQGQLQKWIRKTLKMLLNICVSKSSIGIVTGHMYGTPSMYSGDKIGGGKAMTLLPNIVIKLKKDEIIEDKVIIGNEVTATTLKNRWYPPFQEAKIRIDYKNGIDPYAGILELAVMAGKVERQGAWYSRNGERLGQGAIKASKAMCLIDGLFDEIDEWLSHTGYSSVNKKIEQIYLETGELDDVLDA